MLKDGKWKDYEIVFDYQYRAVMLLDTNKEKDRIFANRESKQIIVGIRYYNKINKTHAKWAYGYMLTYKGPLNPYQMSLKQGIQRFIHGKDKLIYFKCEFDKCEPSIVSNMNNNDVLLHDIYKHLLHYPILQKVYHNNIHKYIGYPLQLHEICVILLRCGTLCNFEFSHVSASNNLQTTQMHNNDQVCILHFHPSMRRSPKIFLQCGRNPIDLNLAFVLLFEIYININKLLGAFHIRKKKRNNEQRYNQ
ncbi:hypothetical protein RFI_36889, partial [Reticulomyxa filosa]